MKPIQFTDDENIPDICLDPVFKALMTKETPASKVARDRLLSAVIDQPVKVVSLNSNEPPVDSLHQRQIRFDLSVKLAGGELANVEMSKDPTPSEVLKMEYYLARLYGWQEIHGIDFGYQDLKKTWQISLLANRNLFSDKELLHRFVYYDPERRVALNGLTEIITVELKKEEGIAMAGEAVKGFTKEKAYQEKLESARKLKAKGFPADAIAESLDLSPEVVESIIPYFQGSRSSYT